jgi:endonuclease/exonuclease/phosphatase family metal-dependent hydrolase
LAPAIARISRNGSNGAKEAGEAIMRWTGMAAAGRVARVAALAAALGLGWAAGAARAQDDGAVELRVMTFNVWYGGEQVSLGQVVEAIRAAHPDIAGIQEPEGNLRKIADALGWPYVDERRHIVSRFPLFDAPGEGDLFTRVEVTPGRIVAVANVHLPATPYGPEDVRDGKSLEAVIQSEIDTRMGAIEPYAKALGELAKSMPVFLTGDFNSPSYLDWTETVAKARPAVRYPVEWPVSKALADAGLRDSYREIWPDPVARPGFTWTPGYPHPRLKPNETFDRIDFVWNGGDSETTASELVGEPAGPDVDIAVAPWPSDHRAVVSTFRVVPAVAPAMVAVDRRRLVQGDPLLLRFNLPGLEDGRVSVVRAGSAADQHVAATIATGDGTDRPSIRFATIRMKPQAYDAVLTDPDGNELARTPFWVLARDAAPQIATDKARYRPTDPIVASFKNAPGLDLDWIGIYAAGDPDAYNYYNYFYTDARIEGSVTIDMNGLGTPLDPGDYELRLMLDDSYTEVARVPFQVVK